MVDKLRDYKKEFGDCYVPLNYQVDPELGQFVEKSRALKNKLSSRRRKQLEDLGLWGDDTGAFGSTDVADVEAQSASDSEEDENDKDNDNDENGQESGSESSGEEESADDEDGDGEEEEEDEEEWFQKYQKLMAFHDNHGHCKVPVSDDNFGKWVTVQKKKYAKNTLSDEHLQLLQD
jgi:hypothetical protein